MNTSTDLARHMLSFQPNKDAARLCLYHFLIHHCEPETPLNPQLFENFCRLALVHEHWQKNARLISQELQFTLQHYNETFQLNWNIKDIVFPDHWQVVTIKNGIEGLRVIEKWLERQNEPQNQQRVIHTRDGNFLLLEQNSQGEVSIAFLSPMMLIHKGELEPLTTAIRLEYNSQLELSPHKTQYLKVENNSYARFKINNRQIQGMIVRGYVFQNQQEPKGKLNEFPQLYYPLKKMEQYYIDKKSDPDYQELVDVLEKANQLFDINHPEAPLFGRQALERGQTALEHIFINDNMIEALVNQLAQKLSI
ncbi:MAG: hypothetical protein AAF203_08695 [Pseudomonadota bacterium]